MRDSRSRPEDAGADGATVSGDALTMLLEAFASGALSGAAACFATDATYQEAGRPPIRGRDAIAAWFEGFAASGMTWRFTVDEVIRNASAACIVYRFEIFGGSGEPQRERAGCALVRCDERGQVIAWREYQG